MEKTVGKKLFEISSKELRNLNIFWLGSTLYIVGSTVGGTGYVNFTLLQSVQILGLALIFTGLITTASLKFENQYLKVLFFLYCSWLLILLLRGIHFFSDYTFLKVFLFDATYGGMIYFAPLILLFPVNFAFFKKAFDVIFLFCILYIAFDVIFIRDLLSSDRELISLSQGVAELSTDLSFPAGLLLLTFAYHSKSRQILALVVIAITLFVAIYRARRGLASMTGGIILCSYLLYLFTTRQKKYLIYFTIVAACGAAIYATATYKVNQGIFGYILERGTENTRENVVDFFHADMKTNDWIAGRGINGEYFCPNVEEDLPTNYRSVIETGFLQIILKGGWISLGLYLLIAVPAIFLGLFSSRNVLSKGAALFLLLGVLSMYPGTINTYTLRYLLMWMCTGICYSQKVRNLPDQVIKRYFLPSV